MTEPNRASASEPAGGGNKVVCPKCGRVRLETPPGTTALPTLGMARKAAGAVGECDCGKQPHERPGADSPPHNDLYQPPPPQLDS